ncbi:MAG: hypothetical protein ACO1N2_02265 [Candidatus Saccharimonadota bacterium]|jgi:hypothetical protein
MTKTEKEFNITPKSVAAAAAIVALPVAAIGIAHAQNEQRQASLDAAADRAAESQAATEAYKDSIVEAINAQYDAEAVVGQISIEQGDTLIGKAESLLIDALGPDLYSDIKGRIYSPLQDSAMQYMPHPGDTFYVVGVDLNPEAEDGNEYVVTDGSGGIIHSDATEIPSPETH